MNRKANLILFFLLFLISLSQAQTNYTWTGSHSNNWNDSLNWTPKGIPQSADNITSNQSNAIIILDQNRTVGACNLQNVYLNLKGNTLSVNNNASFNVVQTTSGSLSFAGAISLNQVRVKASINAVCSSLSIKNCVFDSTAYLERIGNSPNDSWQSNRFNGTVSIVQNSPQNTWYLGATGDIGDAYTSDVNFEVKQGSLFICYQSVSFFTGNINLSNAGDGITLGDSTISPLTNMQANGKSITATSFTSGMLSISKIRQQGASSNSFQLTGTASLVINECDFGGNVNISTAGTDTTKAGVNISNSMFRQSTAITTPLANLQRNHFNVSNTTGSQTQIIQVAVSNQNWIQRANLISGTLITKQ